MSSKLVGDPAQLVLDAAEKAKTIADGYGPWLDAKLEELGFEVAPTPTHDHDTIAGRAVGRVRPFNEQGGGYRDTLHWLTLVALAESAPNEDMVMISNDGAFKEGKDHPVLHPQLVVEASAITTGSVELVTDFRDFAPPGRYRQELDADEYREAVLEKVAALFNDPEFSKTIAPRTIGYESAEYVDLYDAEGLDISSLSAHELNGTHEVEVKFVVAANVGVYAPELGTVDGEEALHPAGGITRLRISGVGIAAPGSTVLDRVEDVSLRPATYLPGELIGPIAKQAIQNLAAVQSAISTQIANDPALKGSVERIAKALQLVAEVQARRAVLGKNPGHDGSP
jgi:hypothetical protein